jgi:heme/copper-type cytochrome/quinol oxidase subunit 1
MVSFSPCTLLGWRDYLEDIIPIRHFHILMICQHQCIITIFALIAGAAQLVFLYNFISSIFYGKKAVQNPWKSNTLEWTAPVEHIHGNWPGAIPHVHRWAYDYSKPGQKEDFVPRDGLKLKVKKLKFSIERHLFIYLLGSNNKIFYSDGIQLSLGR